MTKTLKSEKEVAKGDKQAAKGKYDKAMKHYREAQKDSPESIEVYEKLIHAHSQLTDSWGETDFVESLEWTMKVQELKDPKIKRVHAQLKPEWKESMEIIRNLLITRDDALEADLVQRLAERGSDAVYPLIETLLSFKKLRPPSQ